MEGHEYQWRVEQTFCNGHLIYNKGVVDRDYIGQPVVFR
jgi:dihydroorotase